MLLLIFLALELVLRQRVIRRPCLEILFVTVGRPINRIRRLIGLVRIRLRCRSLLQLRCLPSIQRVHLLHVKGQIEDDSLVLVHWRCRDA